MDLKEKIEYGQFYTIYNPFLNKTFIKWLKSIPNIENEILLEPFAGSNNILKLISEIKDLKIKKWICYDIMPSKNNLVPKYKIIKKDTLKNFPKGYKIGITNPPYLAKNSAKRKNIDFDTNYLDLYLKAIDKMLLNLDYIAAIIPESFITSNKYQDRLYAVISLEKNMFLDTETPVCLALFNKEKTNDFFIIKNENDIFKYNELKRKIKLTENTLNLKFNDKNGNIGLYAIDNNQGESIRFLNAKYIDYEIKVSSRNITKISGIFFENEKEIENFIKNLNENLKEYRKNTYDIFLTAFKGLRKDGKYRRRLDYKTAKYLINKTYLEFKKE